MDMSLPPSPPLLSIGLVVVIAVVWAGPMGLLVLRSHLANATGGLRTVKYLLTALTALTAPLAAGMVLLIVAGVAEGLDIVWSLLQNTW